MINACYHTIVSSYRQVNSEFELVWVHATTEGEACLEVLAQNLRVLQERSQHTVDLVLLLLDHALGLFGNLLDLGVVDEHGVLAALLAELELLHPGGLGLAEAGVSKVGNRGLDSSLALWALGFSHLKDVGRGRNDVAWVHTPQWDTVEQEGASHQQQATLLHNLKEHNALSLEAAAKQDEHGTRYQARPELSGLGSLADLSTAISAAHCHLCHGCVGHLVLAFGVLCRY
ncbi:multidrug ABC transporter ATPase, putative [Babesia ovis]|uniref:Multidrug ABC transporter ATPase, putative n=1 Tax=Babesia ovis TaxID=5869 RepID=A0A9W5TB40_BABOV|nr:multidrug ABC transporter ATPase, putative [Babesia ovis]